MYISNGSYSKRSEDIFELVENDIAKFSRNGSQIFACGDFNAHTNCDLDYCAYDEFDSKHIDLPYHYMEDVPLIRSNIDPHVVDARGTKLLNLCKSTGTRILNGRFFGDTQGHYTCYSNTGSPSTIDYMLASESLLSKVQYFHVNDLTVHSIHASLSATLSIGPYIDNNSSNDSDFLHPVSKFRFI